MSARRSAHLLILSVIVLSLGSCAGLLDEIFDPDHPYGLKASDGKYADRIELSWHAPTVEDTNGNIRVIAEYQVFRSPAFELAQQTDGQYRGVGTATAWVDDSVEAGELYTYSVRAKFAADGLSPVYSSDSADETGFAMDADPVLVYSPTATPVTYRIDSGDTAWFTFLLQKGWIYGIATSSDEPLTTADSDIRVRIEPDLDPVAVRTGGAAEIDVEFTAPASEAVYVRISGPRTVSFSYGR